MNSNPIAPLSAALPPISGISSTDQISQVLAALKSNISAGDLAAAIEALTSLQNVALAIAGQSATSNQSARVSASVQALSNALALANLNAVGPALAALQHSLQQPAAMAAPAVVAIAIQDVVTLSAPAAVPAIALSDPAQINPAIPNPAPVDTALLSSLSIAPYLASLAAAIEKSAQPTLEELVDTIADPSAIRKLDLLHAPLPKKRRRRHPRPQKPEVEHWFA